MLHTVDDDDSVVLDNLVDDPVVASPSGPKTREFAEKRLAEPPRVGGDRSQDRLEGGGSHLLRQAFEMPEALWGDHYLVQPAASDVVSQAQPLTFSGLDTRSAQRLHELGVTENVEALLKGLEVVGAHQHERRPAVSSHEDPIVL